MSISLSFVKYCAYGEEYHCPKNQGRNSCDNAQGRACFRKHHGGRSDETRCTQRVSKTPVGLSP